MTSLAAFCGIVPPYILRKLAEHPAYRQRALRTLEISERIRGQREVRPLLPRLGAPGGKHRTIFDAGHRTDLPGHQVRDEGGPLSKKDTSVNEAYDYSGNTYDFYREVFDRNSIDDHGMTLISTVHYDTAYDNAFWDGRQMVYGDGDGEIFERFTISLDVIGHELSHGVTENEAQLLYRGQAGALNESMSDVFGSLVRQWVKKQSAAEADWLIGAGLFTSAVKGAALRSMKAPGTAYDDPTIGKDPQPADMAHYVRTDDDNGGVHINSGIPNRAFYLAATSIGGNAWDRTGRIWYQTLTSALSPAADFQKAATATGATAAALFGEGSIEHKAVVDAWKTVGITPDVKRGMRERHPDSIQANGRRRGQSAGVRRVI